ncbi:hypothetical protein HRG_012176 [Hirsutella rhossiliensis]
MARTRAQSATQKAGIPSAPKYQGKRPQGIRKPRSTRRTTSFQRRPAPERTESVRPLSSPTKQIPSQQSVNEGWNNAVPLTATRPQPDYSVGFRRLAFTDNQLSTLSSFLGDFIAGDQSLLMGTYYMHFPFLTCEVMCGAAALDVADRQNAHNMTLAARAVVELFRLVKREDEVHRQILAFSVSHEYRSVRIYGHYPVINGKDTKYYRHPIREFSFTELDGRDKWTAYRFTHNVYDIWMPEHFKRICSAIDQVPSELDFNVPSLAETGLSQSMESHGLAQSDANSMSLPAEGSQSGNVGEKATPDTSFTGPGGAKRRKGKARR